METKKQKQDKKCGRKSNKTPYDEELKKVNRKLKLNKRITDTQFDELIRKRNILNCKVEQFFVDAATDEPIQYKIVPKLRVNE